MAKKIEELPFPDWLLNTDYSLVLNESGISEDGEPIKAFETSGKCIFSEKAKRIIDSEGKQVTLLGRVIVKGDIAPSLKNVSDGAITINGCSYEIHTGSRPRNPNGTVHHTSFEIK
ncbi:MAG: hypothetical protein K2M17_00290 [Bacilli bacterium]|nr:hypothetical protein [Bacilli bacterium]